MTSKLIKTAKQAYESNKHYDNEYLIKIVRMAIQEECRINGVTFLERIKIANEIMRELKYI